MIKPSVRHVAVNVAELFQCHVIVEKFEDMYAFAMLCIQWSSLARGDASLIETIYGLRRVDSSKKDGSISPLKRRQHMLSVALMVVLPRIMTYLREMSSRINQGRNNSNLNFQRNQNNQTDSNGISVLDTSVFSSTARMLNDIAISAQHIFATVFPYIELGWDISVGLQKLLYVCGRSDYHHPAFALLGMTLMKKNSIMMSSEVSPSSTIPNTEENIRSRISGVLSRNWPVTIVLALVLALRTAEYLQVNQQTLSDNNLTNRLTQPIPVPPAPPAGKVARGGCVPPLDATLCAVCNKKRTNPCASTSGYVMCYICLLSHVRERGTCPVTGQVCRESDIIRLYEEDVATVD